VVASATKLAFKLQPIAAICKRAVRRAASICVDANVRMSQTGLHQWTVWVDERLDDDHARANRGGKQTLFMDGQVVCRLVDDERMSAAL
jgi:hypothetical protein